MELERLEQLCKVSLLAVETERRSSMKWTKPEFEFVELCSEVTSYLYHR
jgi:hypothetical protein